MCIRFVALLISVSPLWAGEPARAKGPADLQGIWRLRSIEANGTVNELGDRQPRVVIKGDRIQYGGMELALLSADTGANPKIIDLKFGGSDSAVEGVYAVDGDKLRICVNKRIEGVKERPTSFATKGHEDWRLLVFRREKKSEADSDGLTGFIGLMLAFDGARKEVTIAGTLDASPAKKAGAKKDDIVVAVNNAAVSDLLATVDAVRGLKPGTELTLRIRRGKKESDITVKVGVMPFKYVAGLD